MFNKQQISIKLWMLSSVESIQSSGVYSVRSSMIQSTKSIESKVLNGAVSKVSCTGTGADEAIQSTFVKSPHWGRWSDSDDSWYLTNKDLGRLMVRFRMLVGGCRVRFLMCRPYCTLDRRRFGLRMTGRLLALSVSCVFPLQLHASLPQICSWLFSLMSANRLSLRLPAAMTDGWFPPAQTVSAAGLCNAYLKHHDHILLLEVHWRRLLYACLLQITTQR